ncbi:MAG: pantoate--beta-alanine ligase [Chloroflexota bacterium]|nr:pantoate--beta-alanine ligase [Chloroflexota bacterium]
MKFARSVADLQTALDPERQRGARIGLVPTMGALHAGHLSLISAARTGSDVVVVSLFVNPAQFGRGEDLERYPRDEARDIAVAEEAGVDVLFAPSADQMYPDGFDTWVDPGKIGSFLEGAARPGHFRGVATICTKLFLMVQPSHAYFGRKDAQQVAVVKQLVRDLELPVEIVACPTVRDADGLALSSRNVFLTPEEREVALALPHALEAGQQAHRSGEDAVRAARAVLDGEPGLQVDYLAEADLDGPTLAAAVMVGSTRLIDNVLLSAEG